MPYVLLVEDNQNNADMVIRLLQSINLEVHHSLRGLEGARMARQSRPALILMDFNLPDIDGRTLVLQLKKQLGGRTAPPIVAITARTGEHEERIAQHFGCTAFVTKPFVPEQFLALIKSLIPELVPQSPEPKLPGPVTEPKAPGAVAEPKAPGVV